MFCMTTVTRRLLVLFGHYVKCSGEILLWRETFCCFLPPLQGLLCFERLTQGVALGYHLSGLQPFESASISVHQRLIFAFHAFSCGKGICVHRCSSVVEILAAWLTRPKR